MKQCLDLAQGLKFRAFNKDQTTQLYLPNFFIMGRM